MKDILATLDAEILAQEHILLGLQRAREITAAQLSSSDDSARGKRALPQLEAPKKQRRAPKKARNVSRETEIYDINDVEIKVTKTQHDILTALFAADSDWVPMRELVKTAGSAYKAKKCLDELPALLKPAGARIDVERGSGVRIVTDD